MQADLSSPSGITLSYESNLFNSIDKINCNHTYTIKLPKTANNTRIFGMPQDVRNKDYIASKRFVCLYFVDGVSMFEKGYAYVISIDEYINITITWNVVDALQKIKDDNFNINLFDIKEHVETEIIKQPNQKKQATMAFDNFKPYHYPFYYQGIQYPDSKYENTEDAYSSKHSYRNPVVPVPYIVKRIEDYYNIRIDIYSRATWDGKAEIVKESGRNTNDVIDLGVIPCVSTKLTGSQQYMGAMLLSDFECELEKKTFNQGDFGAYTPQIVREQSKYTIHPNFIGFRGFNATFGVENDFYKFIHAEKRLVHEKYADYGIYPKERKQFNVTGVIYAFYYSPKVTQEHPEFSLDVFANKKVMTPTSPNNSFAKTECESVSSVEGTVYDNFRTVATEYEVESLDRYMAKHQIIDAVANYVIVKFDMRPEEGQDMMSVETSRYDMNYWFTLYDPADVDGYMLAGLLDISKLEITPKNVEEDPPHYQDLIANLPEVTCMDFIKSLFYQIGSFPKILPNGNITAFGYNDFKENIKKAYDWTGRVMNLEHENISWKVGSFSGKSKYLMKSDSEGKDKDDIFEIYDYDDVYEQANGKVVLNSDYEKKETTVVTLPWYAPFIQAAEMPNANTGNTMKYWVYGKDEGKAAKPCYGMLYTKEIEYDDRKTEGVETIKVMAMDVWNGFKDIEINPNYKFLCDMLKNPIVVKCEVKLNAFDLKELDLSIPAYLNEYNSYFCIIKVERSSDGKCTAELLRIPPEIL